MQHRRPGVWKRWLACLACLLATSSCTEQAAPPMAACPPDLQAVAQPHGRMPFKAGSAFRATFVVSFVVDSTGAVRAPHIMSTDWRPAPNNKEGPEAYEAAVLAVIARWKYPPRPAPCRHALPFRVSMDT